MLIKPLAIVVALCVLAGRAVAGPDEDAVRHLLHSTFDKPEAKLVVEPVVVAAGYAIAGWTQGDMGGRALLRNKQGRWTLILCAGDGIKSAEALRHTGIEAATASVLANALVKAEEVLPPERLAKFSGFEGLLRMDEAGNHPPVDHQKH